MSEWQWLLRSQQRARRRAIRRLKFRYRIAQLGQLRIAILLFLLKLPDRFA